MIKLMLIGVTAAAILGFFFSIHWAYGMFVLFLALGA